jgi:hypothetical protein
LKKVATVCRGLLLEQLAVVEEQPALEAMEPQQLEELEEQAENFRPHQVCITAAAAAVQQQLATQQEQVALEAVVTARSAM